MRNLVYKKNNSKIFALLAKRGGLLIFFIFTFISCNSPYKNLTSTKLSNSEIKEIPYALPDTEKAIIYKTDIRFYKNEISGLLIIKKTDPQIYRIALTTQFGLKIFDFELNEGKLKVQYCVEYLNKNIILKTFQQDFNLLLMQHNYNAATKIINEEDNQKIWQFEEGNTTYNYIENINLQQIANITLMKRNSEKISVGLYSYRDQIPREIKLEHHNIKLNMTLKRIQ